MKGDDSIRDLTKINLQRTFTILYYTGLRLNELQHLKIKHIKELLNTKQVKVYLSKTNSERKLFLTDNFKKDLEKCFVLDTEEDDNRVIFKTSNPRRKTGIHHISYLQQVNKYMKYILGDGYSSHSFRRGLITEMGSKGINVKLISKYIGHSDPKTTMKYIVPTDEDIMMNLIR